MLFDKENNISYLKAEISEKAVREIRSKSNIVTVNRIIELQKEFFNLVKNEKNITENKKEAKKLMNNIITGLIAKGMAPQKATYWINFNLDNLINKEGFTIADLNNMIEFE